MKLKPIFALLLVSRLAAADPIVQTIPPGSDKIVVVREGDRAPFTGQLFDSPTALRWANWLQQYQTMLTATVEHDQKVCAAKVEYGSKLLTIEKERAAALEQDLRARLVTSEKARAQALYEAQNPSWYRTVWFGAGVATVTLLVTTVVVSSTLTKAH